MIHSLFISFKTKFCDWSDSHCNINFILFRRWHVFHCSAVIYSETEKDEFFYGVRGIYDNTQTESSYENHHLDLKSMDTVQLQRQMSIFWACSDLRQAELKDTLIIMLQTHHKKLVFVWEGGHDTAFEVRNSDDTCSRKKLPWTRRCQFPGLHINSGSGHSCVYESCASMCGPASRKVQLQAREADYQTNAAVFISCWFYWLVRRWSDCLG